MFGRAEKVVKISVVEMCAKQPGSSQWIGADHRVAIVDRDIQALVGGQIIIETVAETDTQGIKHNRIGEVRLYSE